MHAGKVLYTLCAGKRGVQYKTNFISLKTVLTFQTLMLAMLGKWATTQGRGFFLGKNCSWTLLSRWTWLQTPITCLYQSSVRSYRTHFGSLKHADDLRVYRGFMMPLNHQAGYKVLWALMHHIFAVCPNGVWFICHNKLCQKSVPRSRSISNLFLNRYLGFWRK